MLRAALLQEMDAVQAKGVTVIVPVGDYKRAGAFKGLRRKIREHGGDPIAVMAEHGLNPGYLDDPEAYFHYPSVIRLLESCAEHFDAPHFGFDIGKRQSSEVLGPLAAVLLASPRVGEALRLLNRYMQVHAPGARYQFEAFGHEARIEYRVLHYGSTFSRQINELSMATGYNIVRAICGPAFKVTEVNISSEPPARQSTILESYFNAPVNYDCPVSSIVFPASFLDMPINTRNPTLLRLAQDHLESLKTEEEADIRMKIEGAIRRLLPTGACTLPMIAQQLTIHPRSLQNRLMEAGLEFREIVKDERIRQARAYLQKTSKPLAEIAILLGYSDQTAFTRAFSSWTGESPLKHRKVGRQAEQGRFLPQHGVSTR